MWTSLCNFLFDKLFGRSENKSQRSNDCNDHIYGKRLKLSDRHCGASGLLHQTNSPGSDSMQKENDRESTDEEDECCVIAEIPRRKKPGNSSIEWKTLNYLPSKEGSEKKNSSRSFTFKKDNDTDDKEIEILNCSSSSLNNYNDLTKSITKPKFFHNQRVFLRQSKMAKSRSSFRKHLRKNINFLKESYRLAEKYQYMQLLQSQTSYNVPFRPPLKTICYEPETIPVIDLTNDDTNKILVPVRSRRSSEQDIQILNEVPKVRSFQDMLKITPINGTDVVQGMLQKHSKSSPKLINVLKNNTSNPEDEGNGQKSDPEDLEEKLRTFMQITTLKVKKVERITDEIYSLPDLSKKQEEKIQAALILEPSQEVLVQGFGLSITRRDMHTLLNLNWLNDEIINFYMSLLMERSKQNKILPKVYAFNTFFYPKLVSNGYMSLKRWTKQMDIFSFDLILVPIHLGMHWCMSMIDFRLKSVQYYDSVGSPNDACLERLLSYLKSESLDKKKKIFPATDWKKLNMEDIPQQMNGSDCGVFSCMFAEHLARDCGILFSQDDMPYFRKKMVIEILEKKLLT